MSDNLTFLEVGKMYRVILHKPYEDLRLGSNYLYFCGVHISRIDYMPELVFSDDDIPFPRYYTFPHFIDYEVGPVEIYMFQDDGFCMGCPYRVGSDNECSCPDIFDPAIEKNCNVIGEWYDEE